MATIVLSAAGMALGGSIGGSVLGLSMATIGRAAGAAIGRRIDQKLLGGGSEPVEVGRIDRFRLSGASEGSGLQQVFGRMRVPGQIIWATAFNETTETSGGGKGTPAAPETTTYSYSISLAVALCEGEISRVGRIWADGVEITPGDLNMRVYTGALDQQPDPKIAAVEGLENVPAYRGTAYVVFEDLPLGQFGNRMPQFTFEVIRQEPDEMADDLPGLGQLVNGVALIPGTGEYSLATSYVYLSAGFGEQVAINTNTPLGPTDFSVSMNALEGELPKCKSVVLVVSWFGDDLRCADCTIRPKVEQDEVDGSDMPWRVAGISRANAGVVAKVDDAPVYGGTPADATVVEAIVDMKNRGLSPVFYPFILMEQLAGNALINPWTGEAGQPALPWRGRITTSLAPDQDGTPDGTADAVDEVASFMGAVQPSDFVISGTSVSYIGPVQDWGYRRFILHYAHLCVAAGGVNAFCIGSEMRSLTQIRGPGNAFPAVEALRDLAADVRAILGPDCKISYAADWSEYHGYQPVGTADKLFHLDALWADDNIDFIGVDNYMPLADWRDVTDHADAEWGSIYNVDYLNANVAGGEGYDWFYHSPEARDAQIRSAITDGDAEPWVWRYKDFGGWWSNTHHNRIDGVRQADPTDWVPQSKPIWFTEFGCAAIDKGANQPNKFLDPKSSESQLPYYSNGLRDDYMQMQYIRAVQTHFEDPSNNPVSAVYGGPMVDTQRMHVWAWDTRPFPFFPGNQTLWSDGDNYSRGHWLNGRASSRSLASVVAEICEKSGVTRYDVSRLYGVVRGYSLADITSARSALQPLMLTYGFDAIERQGTLVFQSRDAMSDHLLTEDVLAIDPETDETFSLSRDPVAEISGRLQFSHLDADTDYETVAAEASYPDEVAFGVDRTEFPVALTRGEGRDTVSRWLQEARVGRDGISFALPPSQLAVDVGDVVTVEVDQHRADYRVDRIEEAGLRLADATRVDAEIYKRQNTIEDATVLQPYIGPVPVEMLFMDLPLLTGDEVDHAPYVAAGGRPWPGSIALYSAAQDSDYTLQEIIIEASTLGVSKTPLTRGPSGIWDRQAGFEVQLINGALTSVEVQSVLSGRNTFVIGDGSADLWEVVQFQEAIPTGDRGFVLRGLLRGQAGSRGLMPDIWPSGSRIAVMNGAPAQITVPSASRNIERHFRYGPAKRPIGDASFRYDIFAFKGNGLRPYPVAHLHAKDLNVGVELTWIRCTRIDGDIWSDTDVPLGETQEKYLVRVLQDGITLREETVTEAQWQYDADVPDGPYRVEVAQVSERYGAGPFVGIVVGG